MNSKQSILEAIGRNKPKEAPRPSLEEAWIQYDDPRRQFAEMLEGVGGRCVPLADRQEINRALDDLAVWREAKRRLSLVDGVEGGNVALEEIDGPHALEDLDFVVAPGQLAVAENAAVWVDDARLRHRAALFLTQHLALVVDAGQIVHNLHEAYQRLSFEELRFGVFISGPSKTADIEQSLVIGAHGPRSLTVFLTGT